MLPSEERVRWVVRPSIGSGSTSLVAETSGVLGDPESGTTLYAKLGEAKLHFAGSLVDPAGSSGWNS
jgi:hypothetical protein